MNMRDAIIESIRNYHAGKYPERAIEASDREFIYTLEYFEAALEDDEEEDDK